MAQRKDKLVQQTPAGVRLEALLTRLDDAEAELLTSIVSDLRRERDVVNVNDLWYRYEDCLSFWVLFLNGVDAQEEVDLAKGILFWREIYAGPLAAVRCIPSSERRLFGYCSRFFNFSAAPLLVVSNDPQFTEYLRLDGEILHELLQKGGLQRFLAKLHTEMARGTPLQEINKNLRTERFWRAVRIVYTEVKDFVSIQMAIK